MSSACDRVKELERENRSLHIRLRDYTLETGEIIEDRDAQITWLRAASLRREHQFEEKWKEIQEAYQIQKERADYEEQEHKWFEGHYHRQARIIENLDGRIEILEAGIKQTTRDNNEQLNCSCKPGDHGLCQSCSLLFGKFW